LKTNDVETEEEAVVNELGPIGDDCGVAEREEPANKTFVESREPDGLPVSLLAWSRGGIFETSTVSTGSTLP